MASIWGKMISSASKIIMVASDFGTGIRSDLGLFCLAALSILIGCLMVCCD